MTETQDPVPRPVDQHASTTGLVCHKCGCTHFYVIYTRARPNGKIVRRRECRNCGTRILTVEKTIGNLGVPDSEL